MGIRKKIYIDCMNVAPVICKNDGSEGDGADTSVAHFVAGLYNMEIRYEQANSDILPVRTVDANGSNGWQLPSDNTDNEGAEMGFGILADANQQHCFQVGTDAAFEFELKLSVPDVSDYDVLAMGFRTAGAYADAINSPAALLAAYSGATDHKFCINIEAGDFHVQKTTNGVDAEDDVSVTNAVDDDIITLTTRISAAGAVSALVDGSAVTLTDAGTAFDTGDLVVPFFVWCKGANAADTPPILEYIKCGYQ